MRIEVGRDDQPEAVGSQDLGPHFLPWLYPPAIAVGSWATEGRGDFSFCSCLAASLTTVGTLALGILIFNKG